MTIPPEDLEVLRTKIPKELLATHGLYFILDEKGNPKPARDVLEWSAWMGSGDRKVARSTVGALDVSTVFLGIDHNHSFGGARGAPILFETMIFSANPDDVMSGAEIYDEDGEWTTFQWRYETREQALLGHEIVCKAVGEGVLKSATRDALLRLAAPSAPQFEYITAVQNEVPGSSVEPPEG